MPTTPQGLLERLWARPALLERLAPELTGAEREALRAHFDEKLGEGFNYAYVYPGICKVLQSAGRVIRTEDDSGVALLLDDRFFREPYSELTPRHWHVGDASIKELPGLLRKFWRGEAY